jgi:hypothetical protein
MFQFHIENCPCKCTLIKADRVVIVKEKLNEDTGCSLKRNWMTSLLGLKNPLDALHRKQGFEVLGFKFGLLSFQK